jgi:hypothetical protein
MHSADALTDPAPNPCRRGPGRTSGPPHTHGSTARRDAGYAPVHQLELVTVQCARRPFANSEAFVRGFRLGGRRRVLLSWPITIRSARMAASDLERSIGIHSPSPSYRQGCGRRFRMYLWYSTRSIGDRPLVSRSRHWRPKGRISRRCHPQPPMRRAPSHSAQSGRAGDVQKKSDSTSRAVSLSEANSRASKLYGIPIQSRPRMRGEFGGGLNTRRPGSPSCCRPPGCAP